MRRATALVVVLAVLGSPCTDRPGPSQARSPRDEPARCDARPGVAPEGFILRGTREIRQPDQIGLREEYGDAGGRFLVYLLGVLGEVGEGFQVVDRLPLV
ncbi:MAG: hypothetical protein M3135_05410, partial [Actinomycetota bacterium]|nr:hypothetical protein [Actinomycetota bacterium]